MSADDVSTVTTGLARRYPEIQVGNEAPHVQADFYVQQTQLAGASEHRAILPLIIREQRSASWRSSRSSAMCSLARSLSCRLGALAPEHRRASLAPFGPLLLEQLGRALGAELVYYFASLRTRHQQLIAERRGFQLAGHRAGLRSS